MSLVPGAPSSLRSSVKGSLHISGTLARTRGIRHGEHGAEMVGSNTMNNSEHVEKGYSCWILAVQLRGQ